VKEIAASGDRYVGLTVDERPPGKQTPTSDYVVYVLDTKTGQHRRIAQDGMLLATRNDEFVYFEFGKSSKPVILIHGLDTRTFDIGEHNGGWWNPKTATLILETGWPQAAEGFNTLGLLNVTTGAMAKVPVREISERVGICAQTGNFYTEHHFQNDELGADEYDGNGKFIRSIHSPLAIYSSSCGYTLPFAVAGLHGPDDWGVFEAGSGTKLIDYPWVDDGKSDLHWFRSWNPRHDGLLLMYSTTASTRMDSIDAVDVSARKVVKSWPHPEDAAPVEWSSDGDATVTVRDEHVVFEQFNK
jgi:hypothetical protein